MALSSRAFNIVEWQRQRRRLNCYLEYLIKQFSRRWTRGESSRTQAVLLIPSGTCCIACFYCHLTWIICFSVACVSSLVSLVCVTKEPLHSGTTRYKRIFVLDQCVAQWTVDRVFALLIIRQVGERTNSLVTAEWRRSSATWWNVRQSPESISRLVIN